MYHGSTVSIVMPAHNEADAIADVVRGFRAVAEVDEVVVVDNNSRDDTGRLARQAGARVVGEADQGYGFACRRALEAATGDYVIITESDATFRPTDVAKFLVYAEEFDIIFGTRTSKACIWTGSNMGPFLRYGNWAVAKLLEYLHNGPCLTDVGCTYKLFRREALQHLHALFTVGRSHFSAELMTLAIRSRFRCLEIPVHYQPRLGVSKITGSFWKAFRVGLRMIALIVAYRFKSVPPARQDVAAPVAVGHRV